MALNDVTAESSVGFHGQLKIHQRTFTDSRERGANPGFGRKVGAERCRLDVECGQADAAHGHAMSGAKLFRTTLCGNGDTSIFSALLNACNAPNFFYDSGEHRDLLRELFIVCASSGEWWCTLSKYVTLILVRIAQVAFYGEVLAEAVQVNVLDLCCLVHVTEAGAGGEGDRAGSGKDLGGVIQEDLVDRVCRQGCPVHGGSAFDHHAGDLQFSEATKNRRQVRTTIRFESRDFFNAHSELRQLIYFALIGGAAKDEHIVLTTG